MTGGQISGLLPTSQKESEGVEEEEGVLAETPMMIWKPKVFLMIP